MARGGTGGRVDVERRAGAPVAPKGSVVAGLAATGRGDEDGRGGRRVVGHPRGGAAEREHYLAPLVPASRLHPDVTLLDASKPSRIRKAKRQTSHLEMITKTTMSAILMTSSIGTIQGQSETSVQLPQLPQNMNDLSLTQHSKRYDCTFGHRKNQLDHKKKPSLRSSKPGVRVDGAIDLDQ